jgi:hypothetical protein
MKADDKNISKAALILILSILAFFASCIFAVCVTGQTSVPDELPVQLTVVQTVVGSTGLKQCFNDAEPTYFNTDYAIAGVDRLTEFRDYGPHNSCPSYSSVGSLVTALSNTVISFTYPAISAGDIVLVSVGSYSSETITPTSGWSQITHTYNGNRHSILYKYFSSDESSGSVTATTTSVSNKFGSFVVISSGSATSVSQSAGGFYTTDDYSTTGQPISACNLGVQFGMLFVSQSFGITTGTGWSNRFNDWSSGYGAASILTFPATSSTTTTSNDYTWTGSEDFSIYELKIY